MKYCKAYLKDHWKLLLAFPVLGGAALFLFYLYDLPPEPLLYTALVCGAIGLCLFILPDFISYLRKARTLENLKSSLSSTLDFSGFSGTLPETLLGSLCGELCEKIRNLETEHAGKRRDMLEYYTLWVHQIKTPLSAMRLILQSQPGETSDALGQELFKVERYVEMVLGYLRLDTMSSDLRLESCPVHGIVKQAVRKFAPQFIYQKLSLEFPEFRNRVITDEKWLLFVIEQLLSNALKYTKTGGVSISMDEDDVLTIRDTGIGIAPEDLPRVFERGFTGKNGRLEKTSTGLGLYLTKRILDKLQNRIEIQSEPGKGTEVRLYLHRSQWKAY